MIACPSERVERERQSSFAGMDMLSFPKNGRMNQRLIGEILNKKLTEQEENQWKNHKNSLASGGSARRTPSDVEWKNHVCHFRGVEQ